MAIPSFTQASAGVTDAGGAWSYASDFTNSSKLLIFQVLQDGTTADVMGTPPSVGAVDTRLSVTNCLALDGTASAITYLGTFNVGSATAALQHLWIGRGSSAGTSQIGGNNSTSEDLYIRLYEFQNVSTGTTLSTVIENASAGATTNGVGTSTTAADTSVQTLGADRLALNLLAINDDNPFAGFTGESGGTWTTRASFASATGTDGAVYLADAAMATAGTIDGGTGSITDSDAWGVVGFALIGTTVDTPSLNKSFLLRRNYNYRQAVQNAY